MSKRSKKIQQRAAAINIELKRRWASVKVTTVRDALADNEPVSESQVNAAKEILSKSIKVGGAYFSLERIQADPNYKNKIQIPKGYIAFTNDLSGRLLQKHPEKVLLDEPVSSPVVDDIKSKRDIAIREKIATSLLKIDATLDELNDRIGQESNHRGSTSLEAAQTLLDELTTARNAYQKDLENAVRDSGETVKFDEQSLMNANQTFKQACADAVVKASKPLGKDLGWADFLKNLLVALANAVVTVVTLGSKQGMFAKTESTTFQAAKQAEEELSSGVATQP